MSLDIILEWYQGLPEPARASVSLANIHDLSKRLGQKHDYWRAGEPDCPRELKAGNGELHTLRCKRCGLDSPRDPVCRKLGRW